jgi:hypothetical protein
MKNITEIIEPLTDAVVVLIDNGDGTFTSMTKEEYDRRQAEQSTPMIPADE